MKKIIIPIVLVTFVFACCQQSEQTSAESQHIPNYVYVKYRNDKVDVAHPRFEYLDTSKSSLAA